MTIYHDPVGLIPLCRNAMMVQYKKINITLKNSNRISQDYLNW